MSPQQPPMVPRHKKSSSTEPLPPPVPHHKKSDVVPPSPLPHTQNNLISSSDDDDYDDDEFDDDDTMDYNCLLYTSPSPRDGLLSRMPSSA